MVGSTSQAHVAAKHNWIIHETYLDPTPFPPPGYSVAPWIPHVQVSVVACVAGIKFREVETHALLRHGIVSSMVLEKQSKWFNVVFA